MYLYRDPTKKLKKEIKRWAWLNENGRDLRDPDRKGFFKLDKKMKKLMNYDQYVKDVKAGRIKSLRKDRIYQGTYEFTETDPGFNQKSLLRLYNNLIVKAPKAKPKSKAKEKKKAKKGKKYPRRRRRRKRKRRNKLPRKRQRRERK